MAPPIDLPAHVNSLLGITDSIEVEGLSEKVEQSREQLAAFGLVDEDVIRILAGERLVEGDTTVDFAQRDLAEWKSLDFDFNGVVEAQMVYVSGSSLNLPPTAVGQFLLKVWMNRSDILDGLGFKPGALIVHVAKTRTDAAFISSLTKNWALACQLHDGKQPPPTWVGHKQVIADSNSRILAKDGASKFNELFSESFSEFKPKWRFLALYRILEHGYLAEVHKKVNATFFQDPKKSLADGTKALESEMNQLMALVHENALDNDFDVLVDLFEQCKTSMNKYAWAIDGILPNQNGKWRKGVAIFYKLRCSIVHAGMSGPLYDAYSDADACLSSLLPHCEMLSLKFLGVNIS